MTFIFAAMIVAWLWINVIFKKSQKLSVVLN